MFGVVVGTRIMSGSYHRTTLSPASSGHSQLRRRRTVARSGPDDDTHRVVRPTSTVACSIIFTNTTKAEAVQQQHRRARLAVAMGSVCSCLAGLVDNCAAAITSCFEALAACFYGIIGAGIRRDVDYDHLEIIISGRRVPKKAPAVPLPRRSSSRHRTPAAAAAVRDCISGCFRTIGRCLPC